MHQPITALYFDLDGTLYVNDNLGQEINRIAALYLAELKHMDYETAGALIRDTRIRLANATGFDTTLSHACQQLGGDLQELHRQFAREIRPERFLSRNPLVIELLSALSSHFVLYLYTNNNSSVTRKILDLLGITEFFTDIFTIEYTWKAKPDLPTLEQLLKDTGRHPSESLFIGDRFDIDLRLPAAIGCGVCLVSGVDELLRLGKLMHEENL